MLRSVTPKFCKTVSSSFIQSRNTVIVKRVHKPPLIEVPGETPLNTPQRIIDKQVAHTDDDKWMLYEVEEKFQPHHKVKLILLRNVDDYGKKGQIVNVYFHEAYKYLLLPKFAVYHSEENIEAFKDIIIPEDVNVYSSESAQTFISRYSKRVFDVCLNLDVPWIIEPWHIKASLRKHKVWVKSEDIEIPGGKIEGPDVSLENKEFIAILTINNKEQLKLRCRIHHIGEDAVKNYGWYIKQAEPVWESERQDLLDMNRAPPSRKQKESKEFAADIEAFNQWKYEREQRLA
eukprot:GFUD01038695.1.p1 GENE.GFUD01038695.1~~GFUD01038695.1.p1  ORF type:complete len:289 (-),score=64.81 GFUD01038695.1:37-903(-)